MDELATLKGWLLEAQLALHQLLTGRKVASASSEGKSVSYSQAQIPDLRAYIADLQRRIAVVEGGYRPRGPLQAVF